MQKTLFQRTLARLFNYEGGYTNNKYDLGGKTSLGVTQDDYDEWQREDPKKWKLVKGKHGKWTNYQSVKYIKQDDAIKIYKNYYWDFLQVDKMPPDIGVVIFDTAVNSGKGAAHYLLTKTLGLSGDTKWPALRERLKLWQQQGKTQQLVDDYIQKRWAYVDPNNYSLKRRSHFLPFQRGWYKRDGLDRGYSADVYQYVMNGTPTNKPLALGKPGDYSAVAAEHGVFKIPGDRASQIPDITLPGKDGTYILLDKRSHYPLMDDKGKVIVFDSAADALNALSGGTFAGALNEPKPTKPTQTKSTQPRPGMPQMPRTPAPARPPVRRADSGMFPPTGVQTAAFPRQPGFGQPGFGAQGSPALNSPSGPTARFAGQSSITPPPRPAAPFAAAGQMGQVPPGLASPAAAAAMGARIGGLAGGFPSSMGRPGFPPTAPAPPPPGYVPAMLTRTPGLGNLFGLTPAQRQGLLDQFYGRNA